MTGRASVSFLTTDDVTSDLATRSFECRSDFF